MTSRWRTEATALAGTNARCMATLTTTPASGGYGWSVSQRTTTSATFPITPAWAAAHRPAQQPGERDQ